VSGNWTLAGNIANAFDATGTSYTIIVQAVDRSTGPSLTNPYSQNIQYPATSYVFLWDVEGPTTTITVPNLSRQNSTSWDVTNSSSIQGAASDGTRSGINTAAGSV